MSASSRSTSMKMGVLTCWVFPLNRHNFKCIEIGYINSWRIGSSERAPQLRKCFSIIILMSSCFRHIPYLHWWGSHNGEPGPPLRLLDLSPGFIICVGWIFTFALFLAFLNKFMFYLPIASSCGQDPWTSIYLCFGENSSPLPKVLQVRLVTVMVPIAIRGVNLFWDTLRWRFQNMKIMYNV